MSRYQADCQTNLFIYILKWVWTVSFQMLFHLYNWQTRLLMNFLMSKKKKTRVTNKEMGFSILRKVDIYFKSIFLKGEPPCFFQRPGHVPFIRKGSSHAVQQSSTLYGSSNKDISFLERDYNIYIMLYFFFFLFYSMLQGITIYSFPRYNVERAIGWSQQKKAKA